MLTRSWVNTDKAMRERQTATVMILPTPLKPLLSPHRPSRPLTCQAHRLLRHAGDYLAVVMQPSLETLKTVSVMLLLILASRSLGWSGSQHIFPRLDEKDLPFYLDKQGQAADTTLYLYSSLPLLNLNKTLTIFTISHSPFKHITPLAAMEIHPESNIHLQSEFFDFTIWGQLGNYFNKSIEIIKIEREILEILQRIDLVNKKYKDLLESHLIPKIHTEKIITFDRMNFFALSDKNNPKNTNLKKPRSTQSETKDGEAHPHSLIEMYEGEFQHERLRTNIHFQSTHGGMVGPSFYDTAYVRSVDAAQKLDVQKPEIDSFLFRIFYKIVILIQYLQHNQLESLIYLSLLLLLTAFIKVLFTR